MKPLLISLHIFMLLLGASLAHSTTPASIDTYVEELITYPDYGNGDVVVKVGEGAAISECVNGFWLSPSQPGFNTNLSVLLSAYQARNKLRFHAHTDQTWEGSTGKYCKIYQIHLKQ